MKRMLSYEFREFCEISQNIMFAKTFFREEFNFLRFCVLSLKLKEVINISEIKNPLV